MTIYDISQKAGVSIATVSRVLNGSDKVSEKTRRKVMAVMEEFSYTPNAFARGLGLNTTKTIGILCADSSDLYLAKAVFYIEQFLRNSGYDSILCCTGYSLENKIKYGSLILSKKVDSIILVGSNFVEASEADNRYISELASSVPVMLLNADYVAPNVYSCLCDDYHSTFSAAEHLIASGRRNIVYVYSSTSYSGSKKLAGYRDCMRQHGMNAAEEFIRPTGESCEDIVNVCSKLQEYGKKNRMDAVMCADDTLAIGAVKYASKCRKKIPEELAIVGFNNSMLSICSIPELTTIDNRLELLCSQLVANLVKVLAGEEIPRKTIYSGVLVERGTT